MQDFDIFCSKSHFLLSTLLKVSRQNIDGFISLILTIIDSEVVTKEFLGPMNLSGAQTFRVHKLAEIVVVGEYEYFVLRPF